mgnify:CR=1 FL=1
MTVAFDVDDTLIHPAIVAGDTNGRDVPNYENIAIYRWFQAHGCHMVIWSGGGADYARMWAEKLGLNPDEVLDKNPDYRDRVDICFDDCLVDLAKVNVRVKRLKNWISRKDWNKHARE